MQASDMIHRYAAYKWKSALLTTPQPAPPEIASIATLLRRKNGPFQDPTFWVIASQLVAMQNAPPGIQQAHSAWNNGPLQGPQFSLTCYESVHGCRSEHPTPWNFTGAHMSVLVHLFDFTE
jgi:hypothetical protein